MKNTDLVIALNLKTCRNLIENVKKLAWKEFR